MKMLCEREKKREREKERKNGRDRARRKDREIKIQWKKCTQINVKCRRDSENTKKRKTI